MAVWARLRTSFSSLPATSSSSSTYSSSASLHLSHLLDVADDLWFYNSVVPGLPSLSFPCLPSLFSYSPDSSTLIAQCMISKFSPLPQHPLVSSSSSSCLPTRPATDSKPQKTHVSPFQPADDAYTAPPDIHESYANEYNEKAEYSGDSISSSENDEDVYGGSTRPSVGEDEEAYYYYTAHSDWDDDDTPHGYHMSSDCEDEQQVSTMKEEALPVDVPQRHAHHQSDDALSGIYEVAVLLKDQHRRRTHGASYSQKEAMSRGYYRPPNHARSHNEQKELKENLKLWAHLVVSTLATKGRPFL